MLGIPKKLSLASVTQSETSSVHSGWKPQTHPSLTRLSPGCAGSACHPLCLPGSDCKQREGTVPVPEGTGRVLSYGWRYQPVPLGVSEFYPIGQVGFLTNGVPENNLSRMCRKVNQEMRDDNQNLLSVTWLSKRCKSLFSLLEFVCPWIIHFKAIKTMYLNPATPQSDHLNYSICLEKHPACILISLEQWIRPWLIALLKTDMPHV